MPSALINFTQNAPGPGVGGGGRALMGVTGTLVTVSNDDDTNVAQSQFEILYSPPTSAIAAGVKQAYSTTKTWTFTPDVTGGFVVRLRVKDSQGNESVDDRVFGVLEGSGRFVPPLVAGRALNFLNQTLGWLPYVRDYLLAVDANEQRAGGIEKTLVTNTTGLQTIAVVPLSPSGLTFVQARILAVKSDSLVAKWWKIERAFFHNGTSFTAGTLSTVASESFGVAPSWAIDMPVSGLVANIQGNGLTDTVKWYAAYARVSRLAAGT